MHRKIYSTLRAKGSIEKVRHPLVHMLIVASAASKKDRGNIKTHCSSINSHRPYLIATLFGHFQELFFVEGFDT